MKKLLLPDIQSHSYYNLRSNTGTISKIFYRHIRILNTELIVGVFNGKDLVKEYKTGITAQQVARQTKPFEYLFN